MNAKQLAEQADDLFTKRSTLTLLWQEIADNFYPERADFTYQRTLGTDFAANLMTSYPVVCRRTLGDQIGQMLRSNDWFKMSATQGDREDNEGRRWLEWATGLQRRAMYDKASRFTRATKEADHDFAAFGQCVISVELNRNADGLLYRTWHLRDVVWQENENGEVATVFRKWKPTARDLVRLYPKTVDPKVVERAKRHPFEEMECLHMVVEADMYDGDAKGRPRFLICYDRANDKVLEALPIHGRHYLVPRWQTVSGSQYAFSPAAVAGLPDGRLLQAMTLTLLEAGEKITNPPMVATMEAVRSDINIYAGGVTWVDIEYDERLGEALRPITTDAKGMPIGIDMQRDTRQMLMESFYLNKIAPPLISKDPRMTAFQAGQVIQQWLREAMPIFEPMEMDYNGAVCEETFEVLMRAGAFGSPRDMPRSLQGADVQFRFRSPLHDVLEQAKGQKFLEMKGLIAEAIALDQGAGNIPDIRVALRDALLGIGVPARWARTEADVDAINKKQAEDAQADQLLARAEQASKAAANLGAAQKSVAEAQMPATV